MMNYSIFLFNFADLSEHAPAAERKRVNSIFECVERARDKEHEEAQSAGMDFCV